MVPCLGHEVLPCGAIDLLHVGRQSTGLRSSQTDEEWQETFLRTARKFLSATRPKGPSCLFFSLRRGAAPDAPPTPVLVDIQAGFFGREHFVALFLEEYASPDARFMAFQAPTPDNRTCSPPWVLSLFPCP